MTKLFAMVALSLFFSGCTPDPKNIIGMDNSWLKPLVVLFTICTVIVGIHLIWFNKANKEKKVYSDDLEEFLVGIGILFGPGLILVISYTLMVLLFFLIITFFSNILVTILMLCGALALWAGYMENKKK